ncbi:hypothetical protein [Pseudomonas brassicacearum]|uniref:hypothetical protein n=1 Tax=Pseudomonas brassicacearum TaxID=930166 RepID=UPI00069EDA88|nr:hypothetical protein [Pseudomonas brassicacearum]
MWRHISIKPNDLENGGGCDASGRTRGKLSGSLSCETVMGKQMHRWLDNEVDDFIGISGDVVNE